jgi:hypothetical protein
MTPERKVRHVEVSEGGHVVAAADVQPLADPSVVRASLHIEAGHVPVSTGARLVDAVLDLPETKEGGKLEVTLSLGDAESLDRLRARCEDVEVRPAGSSCLVDAELPTGGVRKE